VNQPSTTTNPAARDRGARESDFTPGRLKIPSHIAPDHHLRQVLRIIRLGVSEPAAKVIAALAFDIAGRA
jgi:hypothetical protein